MAAEELLASDFAASPPCPFALCGHASRLRISSMIKCAHEQRSDTDDMADIDRLTITLPADMAAVVKGAVAAGDYASASEVVREALRDWKMKRALQIEELASLKADIDKGLADLAAGRVKTFDAKAIVTRGKKLLAVRSASA